MVQFANDPGGVVHFPRQAVDGFLAGLHQGQALGGAVGGLADGLGGLLGIAGDLLGGGRHFRNGRSHQGDLLLQATQLLGGRGAALQDLLRFGVHALGMLAHATDQAVQAGHELVEVAARPPTSSVLCTAMRRVRSPWPSAITCRPLETTPRGRSR